MYDRPWHALHRSLTPQVPQPWPKKPATMIFSAAPAAAMTSWLARALGEVPKIAAQRRP